MKHLGIYCVIVWGMLVSQTTTAASRGAEHQPSQAPAELYIIIDDMGYRATDERAFTLPESVTFSILPHNGMPKLPIQLIITNHMLKLVEKISKTGVKNLAQSE